MALVAATCGAVSAQRPIRTAAPLFLPERFFTGRSDGEGRLRIMFGRPVVVHVHSMGRMEGATIVLDQVVEQPGKPVKHRQWRLHASGANLYAGTLSDAAGPVSGVVAGNSLHLRFRMAGGLRAEQWLFLQADGRTALNRMVVRKLGMPVAVLHETITRAE